MSRFVPLAVHSHYSLMRGTASPEELIAAAARRGFDRLAVTDTDGVYGIIRFWEVARAAGIRPLLGAEIRGADGRAFCLVKSDAGYSRLCRLLTRRHQEPALRLAEALAEREGLVILCASLPVLRALFETGGGRDLYLALTAGGEGRATGSLARLQEARALGLPPAAAGEIYFTDPGDWEMHRLLRAIALNTTRDRVPPEELASKGSWLRSPEELERIFSFCPEAVENAGRIAGECERQEPPWGRLIFPCFQGRDPEAAFALLKEHAEAGVIRRYGSITAAARARLDYELAIIREKRFADYFLVVQGIVQQSPRTCGRGSAAASLVSYSLGITHVDPLRHDLYFDRFLNPGRKDPPDIDVDFCWDERDDILKYVFDTYGGGQAAMIANHVTLRPRAAVREVAKVYGLPPAEIGAVTSRLSRYGGPEDPEEAVGRDPLFRGLRLPPPWMEILAWAKRLAGSPRNLSVHCGGVVIAPDGIDRHVPVQRAAKGVPVVQWEKDQAEEAGLVKIDLLGNRSLSVIRDILAAVRRNHGTEIRHDAFSPLDDPATLALMRDGKTMGVFYVESPAMRQLQQKTRRGDFEHLVIHSSMIRPAANEYIREYVRRLRGGAYRPLHPILGRILTETHGIMCYQEDVAKVAMEMGGLSTIEADGLRKILSHKWPGRRLEDYRRQFLAGAVARGVDREVADKVWEMILSFSGYSFCKPHSASYALVSFQACYLKAHYPAEFIAAVISNQGGYYSALAYVSEARRMGLEVLLPDVNASAMHYTGVSHPRPANGRALEAETSGPPEKRGSVRVGFMQVKGLKEATVEALLEERRRRGAFRSIADFLARVDADPSDVRLLIRSGCFDSIAGRRSRPALTWRLAAHADRRAATGRQPSLFEPERADLPEPPEVDGEKILREEADTLGFLVSRHPLTLYRRALSGIGTIAARDLGRHAGRRVTTVGWLITGKLVETRKGEPMEFLSFEDTTDIYETTFFPRAYDRFCRILTNTRPFLLRGKVEADYSALTLTVEEARWLEAGKRPARPAARAARIG
ncbi:MAG TPA: DNA polymerase III subunit alpha [Candidatus Polarisedimenticolia bacterium]|nr:DNA polymerase III subunit alpha [Candidatus Polarisedimenticolia bacterium]